jgi:hypothetical protein
MVCLTAPIERIVDNPAVALRHRLIENGSRKFLGAKNNELRRQFPESNKDVLQQSISALSRHAKNFTYIVHLCATHK